MRIESETAPGTMATETDIPLGMAGLACAQRPARLTGVPDRPIMKFRLCAHRLVTTVAGTLVETGVERRDFVGPVAHIEDIAMRWAFYIAAPDTKGIMTAFAELRLVTAAAQPLIVPCG